MQSLRLDHAHPLPRRPRHRQLPRQTRRQILTHHVQYMSPPEKQFPISARAALAALDSGVLRGRPGNRQPARLVCCGGRTAAVDCLA